MLKKEYCYLRVDFWSVSADTPGLAVCFSGLPGTTVVDSVAGLVVVVVVICWGDVGVVALMTIRGLGLIVMVVTVVVLVGLVETFGTVVVTTIDEGDVYCGGLEWACGFGLVMNVWWLLLPVFVFQLGLVRFENKIKIVLRQSNGGG